MLFLAPVMCSSVEMRYHGNSCLRWVEKKKKNKEKKARVGVTMWVVLSSFVLRLLVITPLVILRYKKDSLYSPVWSTRAI